LGKFLKAGGDALALYVRHAAWLNAVPEVPQPKTGPRAPRKSRLDLLKADEVEPDMPPLEWGRYLVDYLFEFGPTMAAGMGSAPLAPSEIEAAQRLLGIQLQPWEARLLLQLSREYLAESHRATEQGCPPPWDDPIAAKVDELATAKRLEQDMLRMIED
jgi:hypothetical protein